MLCYYLAQCDVLSVLWGHNFGDRAFLCVVFLNSSLSQLAVRAMSPDVLFLYSGDSVRSFIILTSIVSLIALVCRHLLARPQAKLCIPRVGKDPNIFGMATSKADFLVNGHRYIAEGYAQVLAHDIRLYGTYAGG